MNASEQAWLWPILARSEPVAKPSTNFKLCLPSSTYMRDN
jgi:hypothetical protein